MATQANTVSDSAVDQVEADVPEFSLADLAGVDATDIQEVRYENLAQGVFEFQGTKAEFTEREGDDGKYFELILEMQVIEVKAVVDRNVNREELIGKKHTEKRWIRPSEAADNIGKLRAFYADIGLPNAGNLGGVPGQPTGFVDGFVDHIFTGKIMHKPRKNDPGTKDARLRIEPPKKK